MMALLYALTLLLVSFVYLHAYNPGQDVSVLNGTSSSVSIDNGQTMCGNQNLFIKALIDEVKGALDYKMAELKTRVDNLELARDSERDNRLNDGNSGIQRNRDAINILQADVTDLKDNVTKALQTGSVGFTAVLTSHINIGGEEIVKYDSTIINFENGYNNQTGIFTAPISGVYQFTASAMPTGGTSVHLQVVQNGIVQGKFYCTKAGYETTTLVLFLQLNVGDLVWIRHDPATEVGQRMTLFGDYYSFFSGFVIKAN